MADSPPPSDCHIQVRKNFYSVPFSLRGKPVDVLIAGHPPHTISRKAV
ncbi:Mu transposase domain-containing protein [Leptospirillum ferriphilum]|uniref:Transposase for insertion sequence element IS21-like C-terminal domain-containing protein n=1 Tax=Leptospirillum ferriphilum TaxID=178606 RepID=A0A094WD91_9BACT|nr:hypothetical protein [Leptospirillum ferriphilum]KGA93612.1 hypothetical protein LptCag_0225 [Leptospirillum ferriphilum]